MKFYIIQMEVIGIGMENTSIELDLIFMGGIYEYIRIFSKD